MSDPETQSQPLMGGQAAQSGRSTKAYKVAGLTLLACVLIAGQAMIAYFLLSQRGDIRTLEDQNNNLKAQMMRGGSASAPVRMHIPMNALPDLMEISVDKEEAATSAPEKPSPLPVTNCQLEAAGLKPVQVPGFFPACDKRGLYMAQQCYMSHCWCVSPVDGVEIPGSLSNGPARCGAPLLRGSMAKALSLADPVN